MNGEFSVALHALVFLKHKNTIINSEKLSENICTNPVRIRKIMLKLKKAGLIKTKEGINGGYYLPKYNDNINLKQICDALEIDDIVSPPYNTGNYDSECLISSGMADIIDNIFFELNNDCKNKLQLKTIDSIEKEIFSENKSKIIMKGECY